MPQQISIAVPPTRTARYTPTSIVFDSTRSTTYYLQVIRSDTYFLQATRSDNAYSSNENECEVLYTFTRSSYQDYRTLMGNTMMKIVLITDGRCTYRINWSPTDTKNKKNVTSLTTTRRTTGYYHFIKLFLSREIFKILDYDIYSISITMTHPYRFGIGGSFGISNAQLSL